MNCPAIHGPLPNEAMTPIIVIIAMISVTVDVTKIVLQNQQYVQITFSEKLKKKTSSLN